MKNIIFSAVICTLFGTLLFVGCQSNPTPEITEVPNSEQMVKYAGFPDQVAWGKHIVKMGGCGDCHTPKIMTDKGPMPDSTMYLAGHPANMPPPELDRKEIEMKGLAVTKDLTVWIGPWGISYAANITPSESGIGNWREVQFINVFRKGKLKGLDSNRALLPPMSMVSSELNHEASDDELKAIFAYLNTIKPVDNLVPRPEPPMSMKQ